MLLSNHCCFRLLAFASHSYFQPKPLGITPFPSEQREFLRVGILECLGLSIGNSDSAPEIRKTAFGLIQKKLLPGLQDLLNRQTDRDWLVKDAPCRLRATSTSTTSADAATSATTSSTTGGSCC